MIKNNSENPNGFKITELGLLPETWEVEYFLNCLLSERKQVGKIKRQEYKSSGKYPVVDQSQKYISGFSDDATKVYKGDLPIVIFGDHTCIVKYVDFPFICGADGTKVLVPKKSIVPLFMFYVLKNIKIPTRGYNRHFSLLREVKIPLPSLPEQQAIAHVLQTVQEAREQTEEVIRATKELKKSMMKHLFTYGAVPIGEAEKIKLKKTEIGMIPEEWKVVELQEVAEIVYGVQAAVAHLTDKSVGIPILTNINISNEGGLNISTLRYFDLPEKKRNKLILKKGDILFNWRSGSQKHVGKTALFNLDGEFTFSSFILRFRAKEEMKNSFLFYYLNYLKVYNYFSMQRDQSSINSVFNASLWSSPSSSAKNP